MITKVEVLIINDRPPQVYSNDYPQMMLTSHPDMTDQQWVAFGLALINKFKNNKINKIDMDVLTKDDNEGAQ